MTAPFQGPIEKRRKRGGGHSGGQDLGSQWSSRRVQGQVRCWLTVGCGEGGWRTQVGGRGCGRR